MPPGPGDRLYARKNSRVIFYILFVRNPRRQIVAGDAAVLRQGEGSHACRQAASAICRRPLPSTSGPALRPSDCGSWSWHRATARSPASLRRRGPCGRVSGLAATASLTSETLPSIGETISTATPFLLKLRIFCPWRIHCPRCGRLTALHFADQLGGEVVDPHPDQVRTLAQSPGMPRMEPDIFRHLEPIHHIWQ